MQVAQREKREMVVNEGWGRQIAGCPEREERDGGGGRLGGMGGEGWTSREEFVKVDPTILYKKIILIF